MQLCYYKNKYKKCKRILSNVVENILLNYFLDVDIFRFMLYVMFYVKSVIRYWTVNVVTSV